MNLPNKIEYKDENGYGVMELDLKTYTKQKVAQIHEMLSDMQAKLRQQFDLEKLF